MAIFRSTFIIDKAGKLVEALYAVSHEGHAQQILQTHLIVLRKYILQQLTEFAMKIDVFCVKQQRMLMILIR